ncbi:putative methyltransferase NSUN6 [Varroa jacobsoni]|uniref:SAM-dependent MTase RsmB/NOP-type domain-containing protein n=1 Tax=Varroa destructor TaxID=109461 RepID=A0A7M7MI30_VARDE|nr:putative methyltransferase NSUN6 [Varroa destructor]XP_022699226.1 putative methyltransferase NSUN6 [Varroa jacobsoni]
MFCICGSQRYSIHNVVLSLGALWLDLHIHYAFFNFERIQIFTETLRSYLHESQTPMRFSTGLRFVRSVGDIRSLPAMKMHDILKRCDPFRKQVELNSFLERQRDSEEFSLLKHWLCTPPQYTTLRVNTLATSVSEAKGRLQEHIDKCSRREHMAYTVTKHPQLDDTLVVVSSQNRTQLEPCGRQVIVALECGEAVLRGANVFVPGVMGAPGNLQKGDMVAVYVDVDNKCCKGDKRHYQGEKVFIGNGMARVSRDDIFKNGVIHGTAIDVTQPAYNCPPLNNVLRDILFLQNIPSIVCSRVLDPQPGETVLDMCSAPGGKTAHIATLMRNQGTVVALDKASARLKKTIENCALWNLNVVQCFVHDATMPFNTNANLQQLPLKFDRIMLDAPCSALGQRPRLQYRQSLNEVLSYPNVQRALLTRACELVKSDGVIVYSTCSINCAENEDVIAWALTNLPLELAQQQPHLGGFGRSVDGLSEADCRLLQSFEGRHDGEDFDRDTIGFFIAKLRRK